MKNSLKVSQLALILLLIIPGGKYLTLPKVLATQAGRDCWLTVALLLAADFVCLLFLLWAMAKNKEGKSFCQLMENAVGVVATKAVMAILAVFFAVRLIGLYYGTYQLFVATFGINATWLGFALPVAATAVFVMSRGVSVIGRLNRLLFPIILFSLSAILFNSAMHADFSEVLPIAENGLGGVLKSALVNNFWFSDYLFILFVMDGVKPQKSLFSAVTGCFAAGSLFTVFMYLVFVGIYGKMAPYTDVAMSKISQFVVEGATAGRLDWLFISVWTASVFVKLTIFTYSLYRALCHLLGVRGKFNVPVAICASVFCLFPLLFSVEKLNSDWSIYLLPAFYAVQYVLPLAMPLITRASYKREARLAKEI